MDRQTKTDHRTLIQQTENTNTDTQTTRGQISEFDLDHISAMLDADDLPSEVGEAPKSVKLKDESLRTCKDGDFEREDGGSSMSEDSEVILNDTGDVHSQQGINATQVPSISFHDDDTQDDTGSHDQVKMSHEQLHDMLESGSHDQESGSHDQGSGTHDQGSESHDQNSQAGDSQSKPSSSEAAGNESSASDESKSQERDLTDYMGEQRKQSEELKAKGRLTCAHTHTHHVRICK